MKSPSEIESRFRSKALVLDEALGTTTVAAAAAGIAISDESARNFHYKNHSLEWSFRFHRDRIGRDDIERVTVWLTYADMGEDEPRDTLGITIRAEKFRPSSPSTFKSDASGKISFGRIQAEGLSDILMDAFRSGEDLFPKQNQSGSEQA